MTTSLLPADFRPGNKVLLLDGGSHVGTVTGAFGFGWYVNFGGSGDAWLIAASIAKLPDNHASNHNTAASSGAADPQENP